MASGISVFFLFFVILFFLSNIKGSLSHNFYTHTPINRSQNKGHYIPVTDFSSLTMAFVSALLLVIFSFMIAATVLSSKLNFSKDENKAYLGSLSRSHQPKRLKFQKKIKKVQFLFKLLDYGCNTKLGLLEWILLILILFNLIGTAQF